MNFSQYLMSGPMLQSPNGVETTTKCRLLEILSVRRSTVSQIAKQTGLTRSAVWAALDQLRKNNKVEIVGNTKSEKSDRPCAVWGLVSTNEENCL